MKLNEPYWWAFWRHDSAPYWLGGEVVRVREDGLVETKQYGPGRWFRPKVMLPSQQGAELYQRLKTLRAECDSEKRNMLIRHREKAAVLIGAAVNEDLIERLKQGQREVCDEEG